ncbi:MAG: mevalonate kinase family protein, partial [Pseudomonadales bacterium]
CPQLDEEALLPLARQAHQQFQRGHGSGADVALAVYEEPIVFQDGRVQGVSLPEGLHLLFVWTGRSANSRGFIDGLEVFRQKQPETYEEAMHRLSGAAQAAAKAVHLTVKDFADAMRQYNRQLQEFSDATGLGIYTREHQALQKKVKSAGCIYKPSGAGGGDFGIACSTDPESITALKKRLDNEGAFSFRHQP